MSTPESMAWFKNTFGTELDSARRGTPFTSDLLVAIAYQETGNIWGNLQNTLSRSELLSLCVGDTLDEDGGRRAFPRSKAHLLSVPRGPEMFDVAREALNTLAKSVKGYSSAAKNPDKFCHGYGIFQVDLQFFKADPDFFLQKRWTDFKACVSRCVTELTAAAKRIELGGMQSLTDLDQVHVAIAYNSGGFKPQKGLKQGYFNGTQFYGERIFDLLRMSRTVGTQTFPASLPEPMPGKAALAAPTPLPEGKTFRVDVTSSPLRVRSEARVDKTNKNILARLPSGQLVRMVGGKVSDKFLEIETSLHGAHIRGFAAAEFLTPVTGRPMIELVVPALDPPTSGIVAVFAPPRTKGFTKRTAPAGARSLNEPGQPGRQGKTPDELRQELASIVEYLAVDKPVNTRYQPAKGLTFCNIYAHDYCHLAGVYLPRVWWTQDAIERLAQGQPVEPKIDSTIDEQRANDLFRWFKAFGPRFGWRQTGTLTKLQTEVNAGPVGIIVARRTEDGRSGHIVAVVPATETEVARRDNTGAVIACLQSQAGSRNFRYGTGKISWWMSEEFADSAFWIHA